MPRRTDAEIFFDALKASGGSVGNITLRKQLGWEEDKYRRARDRLLADKCIEIAVGHGGKVQLSQKELFLKEEDLYPSLRSTLIDSVGDAWGVDEIEFEVTARRRGQLGRWSQPDLCAISRKNYRFQKRIELWTFEIKPKKQPTVEHVLEAVAHSSFAHRTYIMFHVENDSAIHEKAFVRCLAEAAKHEIGFATFRDPRKYSTFTWHLEAIRKEPSPEDLDDFVEKQLPSSMRERILRWL